MLLAGVQDSRLLSLFFPTLFCSYPIITHTKLTRITFRVPALCRESTLLTFKTAPLDDEGEHLTDISILLLCRMKQLVHHKYRELEFGAAPSARLLIP